MGKAKKKKSNKEPPKSLRKSSNRWREKAQLCVIIDDKDDKLKEGIELPIEERDEAEEEARNDDNRVDMQRMLELEVSVATSPRVIGEK
jgi:hypothetical protein